MTDQELERRLCAAVEHAAPDQLQSILSSCGERKGTVIPMTENKKNKRRFARMAAAACLALLLVGGGAAGVLTARANAVASIISLDVNPSIELKVSKSEKVLSADPLNAEAEEILTDLPLKGTDLNVAVNAIVGSLLRHGYLDSIASAILISVEDEDQARATRLEQSLTTEVGAALQNAQSGASVLSQTLTQSTQLDTLARENNISVGKASLIQSAMSLNSALTFDGLAALSVEELSQLVETGSPAMPVGREAAAAAALAAAGVSEADAWELEVDAELDERTPCYEVEFKTSTGEYEYAVDAYTGEILWGGAEERYTGSGTSSNSGSGGGSNSGSTSSGSTSSGSAAGNTSGSTSVGGDIGLEKAKSIAFADAGVSASSVVNLETDRDWDDGRWEYEIEFWSGSTEYDYEISGTDGTILKRESKVHAVSVDSIISAEAARDAALAHAGLSLSDVWDLEVDEELDDRTPHYDVEFKGAGMEYEYEIDAASGSVLHYEKDRD